MYFYLIPLKVVSQQPVFYFLYVNTCQMHQTVIANLFYCLFSFFSIVFKKMEKHIDVGQERKQIKKMKHLFPTQNHNHVIMVHSPNIVTCFAKSIFGI